MTKDEFVAYYAANSKVAPDKILSWRVPLPCDCGEDDCLGWQMMSKSAARGLPFEGSK